MTRRELGFLAATAVITAIAGVLPYTDASAVAAFAATALALASLAWYRGHSLPRAGARADPITLFISSLRAFQGFATSLTFSLPSAYIAALFITALVAGRSPATARRWP